MDFRCKDEIITKLIELEKKNEIKNRITIAVSVIVAFIGGKILESFFSSKLKWYDYLLGFFLIVVLIIGLIDLFTAIVKWMDKKINEEDKKLKKKK